MPAIGFQKRFVPLVESGEKRQTIRAMRKRPFVVGDRLYLYSGMRTKQCRKLGEASAIEVSTVRITRKGIGFEAEDGSFEALLVEDPPPHKESLCDYEAQQDGFADFNEMIEWFEENHRLPFVGQKIRWGALEVE